jgi:hypothetical protein
MRPRRTAGRGAVITLLLLAIGLAGCGGKANPNGYNCVNNQGGCIEQVVLDKANGDFNQGNPWYVNSYVQVVPLTCDQACRASSGNPNLTGYLVNYVSLQDANGRFIQAGYFTDAAGQSQYFYEAALPGKAVIFSPVGLTHVDPGFQGKYPYVSIVIDAALDKADPNTPVWYVEMVVSYPAVAILFFSLGHADFVPTKLVMGQQVWGKSGATAIEALFAYTGYDTTPWNAQGGPNYRNLSTDGVVTLGGGAPPPYANWVVKPTNDVNGTGGLFFTECCLPLP